MTAKQVETRLRQTAEQLKRQVAERHAETLARVFERVEKEQDKTK